MRLTTEACCTRQKMMAHSSDSKFSTWMLETIWLKPNTQTKDVVRSLGSTRLELWDWPTTMHRDHLAPRSPLFREAQIGYVQGVTPAFESQLMDTHPDHPMCLREVEAPGPTLLEQDAAASRSRPGRNLRELRWGMAMAERLFLPRPRETEFSRWLQCPLLHLARHPEVRRPCRCLRRA